ncbi:hypothetical protein [Anaeromicropila herbilytica]|uniref:Flagellar hook-associated protein 2 n=1 Tax=Anaeromicropila herbilytica TaxID=2785025 RepID=A0A7R7EPP7_9FIRM|nr:hypothetical protein [Anaeromicropila herbilytica]BCN32790.1 hypothetical protein bsdtb5_40850 [Anaeromicropila herbilytica]
MINTTYNYLPINYSNNKTTKYHSHKKSELKTIYNSIINLSRKSPVYLLNITNTNNNYALSLKQNAINLHETMLDLDENTLSSITDSKEVISSNTDIVDASLTTSSSSDLLDQYLIKVKQLATSQVNTGKEFNNISKPLKPGNYRFSIRTKDDIYEFQYNISTQVTSKDTQLKLVDYINQANIGVLATFESSQTNDAGRIRLESTSTGSDGNLIFSLQDQKSDSSNPGIIDILQLNTLTSIPKNAVFELNGEEKTTSSNSFCINKSLNINLNASSNEVVTLSLVPDRDKIIAGLDSIIQPYNDIIRLSNEQSTNHRNAKRLMWEVSSIVNDYKNEFESCGLNINSNNEINLEESLILQAANDGDLQKIFSTSLGFIPSILNKSNEIMLNPMKYLDKTIVYYKDVTKPGVSNPYMTSIYSGMIFNSYC